MMFGETPEQKAQRKDLQRRSLGCTHISGLPLIQGVNCSVIFEEDNITIKTHDNNSTQFRLAYNKIVNLQAQSGTEIDSALISSAGGAVGGGMLFGVPGAIVGGRAKQKEVRTIRHYLVISYKKNDAVEYLNFITYDYLRTLKLIEKYMPLIAGGSSVIEL